jgi:hypothetical protein
MYSDGKVKLVLHSLNQFKNSTRSSSAFALSQYEQQSKDVDAFNA